MPPPPREPDPRPDPKPDPRRGMPRSLLYALIPGGFLLIVLILVFTGFFAQEITDEPTGVMDQPPATTQPAPDTPAPDATPLAPAQ